MTAIGSRFRAWWHAPATGKDRFAGLVIGVFAGFWLGFLGRGLLGPNPVSSSELFTYAAIGVFVCAGAGYQFPKAAMIFLFPFATFGPG